MNPKGGLIIAGVLAIALTAVGALIGELARPVRGRAAEAATTVTISTQDYKFAPAVVVIAPGDSVKWLSNNLAGGDISNHTTTSDPGVVPAWNAALPPPNTSFTMTFNTPGTYTYHCEIHPTSMFGTIIVQSPNTFTPTSTATPSATPAPTSTPAPPPNHAPSASAAVSPGGGPAPLSVSLNWSASDPDGDALTATIDWGDATSTSASVSAPYAPQTSAHTYADAGAFVAKIRVADGHGGTASTSATVLVGPDADGDTVPDVFDNCANVPNADQVNTDSAVDNGPGIAGDDASVPNAAPDLEGDACESDGDVDNDGLPDAEDTEPLGAVGVCAAFAGSTDGHPNPAGGDVTTDDNGDGNAALPLGTDAADNGPSWDTDNDGVLDGIECLLGTDPRSAASRPSTAACGGAADADLDGLPASAETCKWGTSDTSVDSDGDGKNDCVEANDTNGDGFQNFPGDTINSAKAANGMIGETMDFDLNGDGFVNFPGDTILSAKMANHVGGICP